VGTKVAAVSRKTNTTTHEVLGVMTEGKTQICFFDTPGLIMRSSGLPKSDVKVRVESAWSSMDLYDMLVVIFDVHRHLTRLGAAAIRKLIIKKNISLKIFLDMKAWRCYKKRNAMLDMYKRAVKRPWDEDPLVMTEDVMKNISLEVVREKFLDHIHQEIPYDVEHRLIDWKELRDGSLRIEQHLITNKVSQRKIIVGKNGSKIG
ncbi:hypothetical protein R6Q57_024634, partial [Mikania cordata]